MTLIVVVELLVVISLVALRARWLKLAERSAPQVEYGVRHGRLAALRAAAARLDRLHHEGLVCTHVWLTLKVEVDAQRATLAQAVTDVLRVEPALEAQELKATRRELFRAQRGALLRLRHDGAVSDEVFDRLTMEVDEQPLMDGVNGVTGAPPILPGDE